MWEALRRRLLRGFVCAAVVVGAANALAARPPGVVARSGDKITGQVDAGDVDAYAVDIAAGGSVALTVKAKLPLTPAIRVFDPSGAEVNVAALVSGLSKPTVKLKKLVAGPAQTGTWRIDVSGANATTGTYTATFAVTTPKPSKAKALAVPAAGTLDFAFPAAAGATVGVVVTEKSGGPVAGASIVDPSGAAVPGTDAFVRKKTKLTLAPKTMTAGLGTFVLRVAGGAAAATVDVVVTVKFAKVVKRTATLPAELRTTARAPGTVRQGDAGVTVSVDGTDFAAGTEFEFDHAGLAAGAVTLTGATNASFPLAVADDVPFGPHTLRAHPSPLTGEPVIVGEITVLAPSPTVTASSVVSIRQLDAAVTLDITGTGFRDGGTLSVAGMGVTVGATTVVSPTSARATISAASDATIGLRSVTFTQPAAGGGASATLTNAFSVFAPDPALSSLSLASVRQGASAVQLTLSGNHFRDGGKVSVSGSGVTTSNTQLLSDTSFRVDVAVAPDAAFGARNVTYTQPSAGGGASVALTGALTVKAPLPTVTGTSPSVVRQGDTGTTVTVTGTGFRTGGAIAISGTGLTVGSTSVTSDTTATVSVTTATDAAFGARDVTFTQPSAGGGDAATATGALAVNAPIPGVDSASPSSLRQGATSATVTVTGTGFRTGGTISISGTGLTLGATTVGSDTSATVPVTVSASATFGARDVTFTQPASGGADAATKSGALTINAPVPTAASASPTSLRQGDTNATLTVTGTGFRSGGAVTISGTGLTLGSTTVVSDTSATVPVTVSASATFGARDVTFTQPATGGGDAATATGALTIKAPVPTVASASPSSVRQGDTSVTVTVTGTGFRTGGAVTMSGTGLTLGSTTVVSDTSATVPVTVSASATLGARDVTFTQPATGGGDAATATAAFTVKAPVPTVASASPASLRQGDTSVTVTVTGTGFRTGGAVTMSGTGLTLGSTTVVSDTSATVPVTVSASATLGARDVTFTQPATGGGDAATATGAFTVKAPIPTVASASPASLRQGDTSATLTVTGTGFRSGGAVTISGTGLTLGATTVVSDTSATIPVTVSASATFGARDVTFTQPASGGGDAATATSALTINAPVPTVTSASPATLKQNDSNVTVTLTGTGFRTGGTITVSGTGVTVGSTSVTNDTTATVAITVASNATVGTRNVTFTQAAGVGGDAGTKTGGLTVNHPDPTFTVISPTTVTQGQTNVSFTLTGTNFRDSATVSFGADITVTSYVRNSDTSATVLADIGSSAAFGLRNAVYTQPSAGGGAAATLTNAITVNAPTPSVSSVSPTVLKQGATSATLTVNGSNFRSGGSVTISGTGLTLGSTTFVSSSQVTVPVTVADTATTGTRNVTFTQPSSGGSASGTGNALLTINYPDPTISTVSPTTVVQSGTGTFTVNGTGLRTGFSLTTTGTGVTLSNLTHVSSTQVTASYSVASNATLSARNLTYTQDAAAGGAATTKTSAYTVLSPAPTVSSTTPSVWLPGSSNFTVRIVGTGFNAGTTLSASGSGVTITNLSSGSPDTEMTLRVTVASNAALGARDVTITPGTGGGPATAFTGLVTIAPADPEIASFSHATLAQGASSISVTILGQNFRSGDTVATSGTGVTFGSITLTGTTQIAVAASVSGGATTGLRNLTVTHSSGDGGRAGTLTNAFTVTAATPTVSAINPSAIAVTASGGPTRDVPVTVTGTNFMSGATLSVAKTSGSGVSVKSNSSTVVSGTSMTAVLTVTASATTGTWNVTVTNPASLGNATANNLLMINSATTLTVNAVTASSGSAHGGERVTIHGGGFGTDAVVDFGANRGLLTQVLDGNTLVTTVPQPSATSSAAATLVNVTVTASGSASTATLTNGYAYARDGVPFVVRTLWPPQGATGIAGNVKRVAALLSAPCDTTTGTHGSTLATNSVWFLSGGSVTSTARSFGPLNRWLVLSRSSGSALTTGTYVLNAPTALTSAGARPLAPVRLAPLSTSDQYTFGITSGTSDTTAPTLSSITPTSGATGVARMSKIVLVFSEEIDPLTVTTTNIALSTGGSPVGATLDLASDLKTVTITPHMRLAAGATYTTTIGAGLTDMCGNAITSTAPTFGTRSSDTVNPTIDAVILERLPSDLDGSGTYVNTSGTGGNAFDVFLPRNGFLIDVRFSDDDSGIDPATFSAKCSVAVGGTSANTELASNFTVTGSGATWRIPSGTDVTASEDVVFTFLVGDYAARTSSASTVTVDVVDKGTTATGNSATGHGGGDHDPLGSMQTWLLRTDFDAYTVTYSGSGSSNGATTSVASDNASDFEQALRYAGLGSGSMTSAASTTVNGTSTGTNAIMARLVAERIRELTRARYDIGQDGLRGADSPNIEFLLAGEQGSLSSLPTFSTSNTSNSGNAYSEITIGGTVGAESGATTSSSILGQAWLDARNLKQEANLNTGIGGSPTQTTGIYLLGIFKLRRSDSSSSTWGGKVLNKFVTGFSGAVPVGESSDDDDVLAGSFDRTAAGNTSAQNARYDAIMDAIELVALYTSAVLAHEIGHSTGLVADGAPKTGLFGNAHYSNTFTEATSTNTNTSGHLDYLGNDVMSASVSTESTFTTGTDFKRFSPLDIAYLLNRLFFDEGR